MEAWRQWPLGGRTKRAYQKQTRINLTPTGLLMEGDYTNYLTPLSLLSYETEPAALALLSAHFNATRPTSSGVIPLFCRQIMNRR